MGVADPPVRADGSGTDTNPDATPAQRFYRRWATVYDLVARRTPGIGSLRERSVALLGLNPGDTVVEMGCGTGANLPYLRERVGPTGTVVGVDFTAGVLDRARRSVGRRGWDNVHLVRADATRPPVCAPVDAVLATFVVGMLADPGGEVERWCELVRPGGRIGLVNASRSDRWYGPVVNVPFRGLVYVSTPGRRRWSLAASPTVLLDRRVSTAHAALRRRCSSVLERERALGLVEIAVGTVPDDATEFGPSDNGRRRRSPGIG